MSTVDKSTDRKSAERHWSQEERDAFYAEEARRNPASLTQDEWRTIPHAFVSMSGLFPSTCHKCALLSRDAIHTSVPVEREKHSESWYELECSAKGENSTQRDWNATSDKADTLSRARVMQTLYAHVLEYETRVVKVTVVREVVPA